MSSNTCRFSSVFVVACLGVCALLPMAVSAQAVDCAKTANAVQKTICGDDDLMELEAKMLAAYGEALKQASPEQTKEIAEQHARWVTGRDACSKQKDLKVCVTEYYDNRISLLMSYADKSATPQVRRTVTYVCGDKSKLTVEYIQGVKGQARVTYAASNWTLDQVPSASGARYSNNMVTVWSKGNEVVFEREGKSLTCLEKTK